MYESVIKNCLFRLEKNNGNNIYCEENFQSFLPCKATKMNKKSIFGVPLVKTEATYVR